MWKAFKLRRKRKREAKAALPEKTGLTAYSLHFLRRRILFMLFISALGSLLTAFGTYVCRAEYKASVKIFVQSGTEQQILLFDDLHKPVLRGMSIIPANNIIEMATGELHARTIVDEFNLGEELRRRMEEPDGFREDFWVFVDRLKRGLKQAVLYPYVVYTEWRTGVRPEKGKRNYRNRAIRKFMDDMVDIELVAESDVIKISIWWTDPRESEAIAKRLTGLVVEQFTLLQKAAAAYGYDLCRAELSKAREELEASEEKLQAFLGEWDLGDLDKQRTAKLEQLHDVETGLFAARAELAAAAAELAEADRQLQVDKRMLSAPELYRNLEANRIALEVKVQSLEAKKGAYEDAKEEVEAEIGKLMRHGPDLKKLQREAELKQRLVIQLGLKQDELAVQRVSELSGFNLKIIDTPDLPQDAKASWPDWLLNMLIGIPASIVLAIGLALLGHLWNDPFWTRLTPQSSD